MPALTWVAVMHALGQIDRHLAMVLGVRRLPRDARAMIVTIRTQQIQTILRWEAEHQQIAQLRRAQRRERTGRPDT